MIAVTPPAIIYMGKDKVESTDAVYPVQSYQSAEHDSSELIFQTKNSSSMHGHKMSGSMSISYPLLMFICA